MRAEGLALTVSEPCILCITTSKLCKDKRRQVTAQVAVGATLCDFLKHILGGVYRQCDECGPDRTAKHPHFLGWQIKRNTITSRVFHLNTSRTTMNTAHHDATSIQIQMDDVRDDVRERSASAFPTMGNPMGNPMVPANRTPMTIEGLESHAAIAAMVGELMRKNTDCFKIIQIQQQQQQEMNAQLAELRAEVHALRQVLGTKADVVHAHTIDAIAGLPDILASKAEVRHNHGMEQVHGLEEALDGKAPFIHAHKVAQVEGLQVALVKKADVDHTHTPIQVEGLTVELNRLQQDAVGMKVTVNPNPTSSFSLSFPLFPSLFLTFPHFPSKAAIDHTHDISGVNGLREASL